jgi:hypothetical protein
MQTVFFLVREVLIRLSCINCYKEIRASVTILFSSFLCLFQNRFKTVIVRGLGMILFKILVIKR